MKVNEFNQETRWSKNKCGQKKCGPIQKCFVLNPRPPLQKMTNFAVVVDITYARGGKWLENKE